MRERNWRAYDRFRKVEERAFLRMARRVVFNMDSPWEPKEGGRPAIPVKGMVLCCLFKYKFKYDYRGLVSHLNAHRDLLRLTGLKKVPSRSSIHRAMAKLPIPYLRRLNDEMVRVFKKGIWLEMLQASPRRGM